MVYVWELAVFFGLMWAVGGPAGLVVGLGIIAVYLGWLWLFTRQPGPGRPPD